MKRTFLPVVLAMLSAWGADAQIFDAGYAFTYHFDLQPGQQSQTVSLDTGFWMAPEYQSVTATVQWELFEGLPVGLPTLSGVWKPGDVAWVFIPPIENSLWQDGEGSFRISVLSGTQRISRYDILVARPDPATQLFTVYAANFPPTVPEPTTFVLFAVPAACALALRCRSRVI